MQTKKRGKESERLLKEIILENYPNLKTDAKISVQEAKFSNKINPNRSLPRHVVIKLSKINDNKQILRASRDKKNITWEGIAIQPYISQQKPYR